MIKELMVLVLGLGLVVWICLRFTEPPAKHEPMHRPWGEEMPDEDSREDGDG